MAGTRISVVVPTAITHQKKKKKKKVNRKSERSSKMGGPVLVGYK